MKTTIEKQLEEYGQFVCTNEGTSMMPLLRQHRDLMIIGRKPNHRLGKYDVPVYRRANGQCVLHRILRVDEDSYVMCGDNQFQREYGVTDDQVIGVLVGFVRDGVTYSTEDRRYKVYVHLWCDFFPIRASLLRCRNIAGRIKRKLKKVPLGDH